jgi:hypothetical protein
MSGALGRNQRLDVHAAVLRLSSDLPSCPRFIRRLGASRSWAHAGDTSVQPAQGKTQSL